ncbi:MAG: hypothetical protein Q4E39_00370 [bacterium]|nr:hypothetical protein [bacterium]
MKKEEIYQRIDNIFNKEKTRNLFKKQTDLYLEFKNNHQISKHKYSFGDLVKLDKGMFMRGEGALAEIDEEKIKFISENGFISPDIIYEFNSNQKTPLCIPIWNIQKDMYLKDYINIYSGATLEYTVKSENYKKYTSLIPYKKIEETIESLRNKEYWMWRCEQTKEIRFMPSLAKDDPKVQIAFIMDVRDGKDLIKNDIFNLNFDKDVLKDFIKDFFINDFIYAERNDFTTNREGAIILGIPSCFIEGILVGRILEQNPEKLAMIKKYFSDCYICNLDGKVIM